jgi:Uma2 family endonuclease
MHALDWINVPEVDADAIDHRVILHGVSWEVYSLLLQIRGENAGPRMAYLGGELEIMSPSENHERIKTRFARLLEAYTEELDIDLEGLGSMTMRKRIKERGLEPDECYVIGGEKKRPDIAIEVVWTSGGIDKLEIYRGLRIPEVWTWKKGRVEVHALRRVRYEAIAKSEVLPEVDLELIARFIATGGTQAQAVKALRAALRESSA